MKIRFLEIAQVELDEAIDFYNYEVPDLGEGINRIDGMWKYRRNQLRIGSQSKNVLLSGAGHLGISWA